MKSGGKAPVHCDCTLIEWVWVLKSLIRDNGADADAESSSEVSGELKDSDGKAHHPCQTPSSKKSSRGHCSSVGARAYAPTHARTQM